MIDNTQLTEVLGQLVDSNGLGEVLEALAEVCQHKADHLRTNWQDETTARLWDRSASICQTASERLFLCTGRPITRRATDQR